MREYLFVRCTKRRHALKNTASDSWKNLIRCSSLPLVIIVSHTSQYSQSLSTLFSSILESIIALYYSLAFNFIDNISNSYDFSRITRDCCYDCLVKLLISSAITSICFSCNDKMCKQETALIIDHASNKRTIQEDVFLLQKPIVCLLDSKYFEIFRILFFV